MNRIVEISDVGRAPKNDPAIFALALVVTHGDVQAKAHAFANPGKVCRIGTHLFHFAEYVNTMRGWGRGLRNAVARWYVNRQVDDLAHQAVKYQQRDGWSHGDLLRLAHPKAPSPQHDAVFRWMLSGSSSSLADSLGEREVKPSACTFNFYPVDRSVQAAACKAVPRLRDWCHSSPGSQFPSFNKEQTPVFAELPRGEDCRVVAQRAKTGQ